MFLKTFNNTNKKWYNGMTEVKHPILGALSKHNINAQCEH